MHRAFAPGASEAGCETWARGWGPHGWVAAPSSLPLFLGPGNGAEDTATAACLCLLLRSLRFWEEKEGICASGKGTGSFRLISYVKIEALK